MATLERLFIVNLNSMTEVPPGIEFLVTLQYLCFYEITPGFLTLLRQCPRVGGMRRFWHTFLNGRLEEPDFELTKPSTGKDYNDYNGTNNKAKEKGKLGLPARARDTSTCGAKL
jgi:hypothetical protein